MLKTLLTGLALSLPVAAMAQEPAAKPQAPAAEGAEPAPRPEPAKPAATKAAPAEPAEAGTPDTQAPATAASPAPAEQPAEAAQKPAEKPAPFLPNLFDVTVVDTWDTLNVRQAPDGQAKVIATLPATAKGIELVARDPSGKWGKVNSGEQTGWVALRFLKQQTGVWQAAALPQSLRCAGTEPFWSLGATKTGLTFAEPDRPDRALQLRKVMDRGIDGEPTRGLIAGDDKGRVTAFLRPEQCSDGMSDRAFALAVSVILDGAETPSRMLMGCCSIAR